MKKRLARSLRSWSMEPDTSITQNITAWLLGSGTFMRLRKRRSMGSRKATLPMRAFSASMRCCSSATVSLVPSSCASRDSSWACSTLSSRCGAFVRAMRRPRAPPMVRSKARLCGVPSWL
ncbi:hypothetical protein D3C71_1663190 [compost metagenome]